MRQRQLRHTFLAHDAPVKSIVVDENEEFFISGSEDGDIKVRTGLVIRCSLFLIPELKTKNAHHTIGVNRRVRHPLGITLEVNLSKAVKFWDVLK